MDEAVGAEQPAVVGADAIRRIVENLALVVRAPEETLRLVVLCLVAEGHLIIEDFPGVGKTMLAKALARSVDCSFSRIQFTPDLLPSDVTGVNVFNQRANEFEFRPGPVFANLLLVDEVNRASPKTQAALLECMQENQVTVDGVSYELTPPFLVMATQNPIEYEGTYPLPEAQLDRFTLRVAIGYPPLAEEARLLTERTSAHALALGLLPYLAAWAFGSKALYPVALGLLVAVLLARLWTRLARRPVQLWRRIAAVDPLEGDDVPVELALDRTSTFLPAPVVLREQIGKLGARETPIPLRGTATYTLSRLPRGRYVFEDTAAVVEDPLGFDRLEVEL